MSDLASQPETSEIPLTLAERRANYEDWLKSGRRMTTRVHTIRTDVHPTDPILAARRAQAEADSASRLLHPPESGCIVRTDVGEGGTPDNEEIRLKLAGALASKMEGVDAETATRMANAGNALLAPLKVRADDAAADKAAADKKAANDKAASDAIVNSPINKGQSHAADDKTAGDTAPTLAAVMDALGKITGRLDAIEGKKAADDNDDPPPADKGKPKSADDSVTDDAFKCARSRTGWEP
jgi:hypothetical protein